MTGPIFDTHAHYSARAFDADRFALLDSLPGKGVVGVCEQATHSGDAPRVLELAHRYPWVVAAIGIHPESLLPAADCGEDGPAPTVSVYGGDWAAEMQALTPYYDDPKVVAVGECGLDYHWPVPKDAQLALFEAEIRLALELDKPIIVRYLTWLGNVVKGDFGTSYCYHKGVWEVISGKLGTTLYMAVLSLLLSMPIGILLGTVTAVKRGQWADTIITLFSNLLIAIPQFVTAILFLYYISMKWKLLPPQGFTWPWVDFHKHIQQLIMPLTCLTLCGIAGFCRQTRSSVLEVLGQDYVRTARAKGLKETRILWKHVMNNGLIPILTMIGGRLASLIGGSIFVENVFNIPGMGNLMVKAVNTMDIPVIQALVLITAAVISVAYIITDLLYVAVDPRISLS